MASSLANLLMFYVVDQKMTLQIFQQTIAAGGEPAVNQYITHNPKILVGSTYIEPNIVIRELQLSNGLRPDFVYIENVSIRQCLHLVEIEDPTKPIFNMREETFSTQFREAFQQLEDYVSAAKVNSGWMKDLERLLQRQYSVSVDITSVQGHLIYGRRAEFQNDQIRQDRWRARGSNSIYNVQTYDRLIDEHHAFFAPMYQRVQPECVMRNHTGFQIYR